MGGQNLHLEARTGKQRAIDALPEHATVEDAIERLCSLAKIEAGLRQSDAGVPIVTIPGHNPANAFTMGGIARDAGLTEGRFRDLL